MRVKIGTWIEKESREVRQCPSYYAADWEVLKTKPGRYPLILDVVGGYLCPMPYWLLIKIDADRLDGATYNGFGGVNFSSNPLPREPKPLLLQMYDYQINQLIAAGKVEIDPAWYGLCGDRIEFAKSLEWGKGLLAEAAR